MSVDASDDAEHRSQTRTVLVLLFLLMVVDYADRQVMVAAFPYLRLEWGVSDVQLGALALVFRSSAGVAVRSVGRRDAPGMDRSWRVKGKASAVSAPPS
jgi:hypothetical protein